MQLNLPQIGLHLLMYLLYNRLAPVNVLTIYMAIIIWPVVYTNARPIDVPAILFIILLYMVTLYHISCILAMVKDSTFIYIGVRPPEEPPST